MKTRLKQLRAELHLSQSKFAAKIHRSPAYISNAEVGKGKISEYSIGVICEQFGVNKDWLVNGEGEMLFHPAQSHPHNSGENVDCEDENAHNKDKSDRNIHVGQRVKQVRKTLKLTQKEFAEKVGYSVDQIYAVESGKVNPSHEFLTKVALRCNVSERWLETGVGEMNGRAINKKVIRFLESHPDVVNEIVEKYGL